jgi:hypothetical protein
MPRIAIGPDHTLFLPAFLFERKNLHACAKVFGLKIRLLLADGGEAMLRGPP